jgi:hypothetical protein
LAINDSNWQLAAGYWQIVLNKKSVTNQIFIVQSVLALTAS